MGGHRGGPGAARRTLTGVARLTEAFARSRDGGGAALVVYLCAGDPNPDETLDLMNACADGGADVIELGVPFSDPTADGPVIQAASERALAAGTRVADALAACKAFTRARPEIPVVLFGYWNPWHRLGAQRAAQLAHEAGAAGILVVDLPPEESTAFDHACAEAGVARVFLVAPTSDAQRVAAVGERAAGFVYLVSIKGVTGTALTGLDEVRRRTEEARALTRLPIAVGFGVAGPAQAEAVGAFADGVVVGSALVARIAEATTPADRQRAAQTFTEALKGALAS